MVGLTYKIKYRENGSHIKAATVSKCYSEIEAEEKFLRVAKKLNMGYISVVACIPDVPKESDKDNGFEFFKDIFDL